MTGAGKHVSDHWEVPPMSKKILGLSVALALLGSAATFAPAASPREVSIQSATGAGNFFTSSGFLREFAFAVLKYSDGSVQGEAQVRNPVLGTLRHFQLDCLSIRNGNLAIASGTVISAENPALVGAPATFAVRDKGQGANSEPDQVSEGVYLNRPVTCETAPTALAQSVLVPIDAGNVRVRGG
jgi:hypothetical protein